MPGLPSEYGPLFNQMKVRSGVEVKANSGGSGGISGDSGGCTAVSTHGILQTTAPHRELALISDGKGRSLPLSVYLQARLRELRLERSRSPYTKEQEEARLKIGREAFKDIADAILAGVQPPEDAPVDALDLTKRKGRWQLNGNRTEAET